MSKKNFKGLQHRAANDPRAAALLVVDEVLAGGADSQAALDKQIKASGLMPGDKALCTELVYGLLRRHLRLEWFLRHKLAKPEKLPRELLLVLELAAYELAHTRIPAHASLNWAVSLVRNRFGAGLAGLANGVLRGFERGLKQEYENPAFYLEKLGLAAGDPANLNAPEFLACFYATPQWIVRLWLKAYGPEKTRICLEAGQQAAPLGLRVNMLRPGARSVLNELGQAPGALRLEPALLALPEGAATLPLRRWLGQGLVSRQSPGAYRALWALEPHNWPGPVWDACAGRGGKALSLIEQGLAVELSSDAHSGRLEGFERDFTRLFAEQPEKAGRTDGPEGAEAGTTALLPLMLENAPDKPQVLAAPAQAAGQSLAGRKFGTVLLDVPCSGLGTLAHRPEIRWRRQPEDLARLCATQAEIMNAAAAVLEPGGALVYLTCTLNPAENRDQVEAFLARHPDFRLELVWDSLDQAGEKAGQDGEFFWGARLRR